MKTSPSFYEVNRLRLEIYKLVKIYPSDHDDPGKIASKTRKRSELFAKALRKLRWLAYEGYAETTSHTNCE